MVAEEPRGGLKRNLTEMLHHKQDQKAKDSFQIVGENNYDFIKKNFPFMKDNVSSSPT